ncbi:MAG: bacteriohemerythrin [Thermoanaerobacterium sp.]|nr:bacteriohemerythrin [Thermoanaerobacterium sp.]
MIKWQQSLSVGIDMIDDEHKELFNRVNDVFDACMKQQGQDKVYEILGFLREYTVKHFGDEEKLLEKYKYPELPQHKKLHEKFINDIQEIENDVKKNGVSVSIVTTLNRKLVDWLINHISKVDKKYGEYIKAHPLN